MEIMARFDPEAEVQIQRGYISYIGYDNARIEKEWEQADEVFQDEDYTFAAIGKQPVVRIQ